MFFNIPISVVPSLSIWDHLHARTKDISKLSSQISVLSNLPYDEAGFLRNIQYSRMKAFYVANIHNYQKPFLADKHDQPEFKQQAETARIYTYAPIQASTTKIQCAQVSSYSRIL
jgi:hypothetical protein